MAEGEAYRVDHEAVRRALDAIGARHAARFPRCPVCQNLTRPDSYGLCSSTSGPHEEWRADVRAEEAARGGRRV